MESANVSGRFENRWEAGLVALLTLVISCCEARLLWDGVAARAIGLHIGLCGLLSAWWRWVIEDGRDARLPSLLAVATAVAGPFGAAGALVTMALGEVFSRTSMTFEEWYESLFPTEETN